MKKWIKNVMGSLLIALLPKRANLLSDSGMTIIDDGNFSFMDRLMRDAILNRAEKKKDFDTLAKMQRNYWVNRGKDFFSATDDSFENAFLPDCAFIFDELQMQLEKESGRFTMLVEIGTGNGKVLNYLRSKFPEIERFVGIDLSPDQIDINREKFKQDQKLEFVASDGFDWVEQNGRGNTIYVTSRGVLEYFTEQRLQAFLKTIHSLGKTIFVAIEPNGVDHDFTLHPGSRPYGHERSFSHNYPLLFENSGFEIWHHSKKPYSNDSYYFSFIGATN